MKFGLKTDRGRKRDTNEDCCNVISGYPGIPVTFIAADGMGGHNCGELASRLAVDFISNQMLKFPEYLSREGDASSAIQEIISEANSKIYDMASEREEYSGMGTTLSVAVVYDSKLYIGHIGDSRVYVFREGMLRQLTTDHSLVEELVRAGTISKQEAMTHPNRNILTRALGSMEYTEIESIVHNILENDIYLICTDGLTNLLSDDEIANVIENETDLDLVCEELVNKANEMGGNDNITVILFSEQTQETGT